MTKIVQVLNLCVCILFLPSLMNHTRYILSLYLKSFNATLLIPNNFKLPSTIIYHISFLILVLVFLRIEHVLLFLDES